MESTKRTSDGAEGLEQISSLLSQMFDLWPDGLAAYHDGRIIKANPRLAIMLGYDMPDLDGMRLSSLVDISSRDELEATLQGDVNGQHKVKALRQDCSSIDLLVSKAASEGQNTGVLAFRDARNGDIIIMDSLGHPFYIVDKDLNYVDCNSAYAERLGKESPSEVRGHNYREFHDETQNQEFAGKVREVIESRRTVQYNHKTFRGSRGYFYRTLSPVFDKRGYVEGIAISATKIQSELVPICSFCKDVRDGDEDTGKWIKPETYFASSHGISFSHSICPGCYEKHYPGRSRAHKKEQ